MNDDYYTETEAIAEAIWVVVGGGGDYIDSPMKDFGDDVPYFKERLREMGFIIVRDPDWQKRAAEAY